MKPIRTVAVFPTMFTLGNLMCGFFAIVVAARVGVPQSIEVPHSQTKVLVQYDYADENHNLMLAGWLIFLAMIFDALDGHVARLVGASSEFGAQLDSLADLVTFGVAPGFLLVKMCHSFTYLHRESLLQPVWLIAATFALCAALRLARFNVESDEEDDHSTFSGLPTPAAGGMIASFALLFYRLRLETNSSAYAANLDKFVQMALPFLALATALLMVSRIPFPHLVNRVFRGQKSFGHVVALVFVLAAVLAVPHYAVPAMCSAFVFVPAARHLWSRVVHRRATKEPLF